MFESHCHELLSQQATLKLAIESRNVQLNLEITLKSLLAKEKHVSKAQRDWLIPTILKGIWYHPL